MCDVFACCWLGGECERRVRGRPERCAVPPATPAPTHRPRLAPPRPHHTPAARSFREQPVLPFNAFGTLAIAREEFDSNSGSSQFFWLLKVGSSVFFFFFYCGVGDGRVWGHAAACGRGGSVRESPCVCAHA